ncbi:MAG: hypothetical protein AAF430_25465 [Myxococcota bacterium]
MAASDPTLDSIAQPEPAPAEARYEPPRFDVICLACEISAYAPDGDPLF